MLLLLLAAQGSALITYEKLANSDSATPSAPGGWVKRVGTPQPCGPGAPYFEPPCDLAVLRAACATTQGCAGFNSNGWLKSCVNASGCRSTPHAGTDEYIGSAAGVGGCRDAHNTSGPMPDASAFEDFHYPEEEGAERAAMLAALPALLSLSANSSNASGVATLALNGSLQNVSCCSAGGGDTAAPPQRAFGEWALVALLVPAPHATAAAAATAATAAAPPMVVLERVFARWSVLVYLAAAPTPAAAPAAPAAPPAAVAVIRSGIGRLSAIAQPRYAFADPCYFERATTQPDDYLGSWLLRAAAHGEPTFVDAAALLTPPHDYKALALPSAYHKWSVAQDGYVKAAEGRIYGPTDGSDSSKVGRVVFNPKAHAAWWPAVNFTDYKASLHGRRGRAAHVGAWHRGAGRGFSLSGAVAGAGLGSIDPAVAAGETATEWLLLRLGEAGAGGGGANASDATAYRYFRAADDGAGGGAANLTDGAAFYAALLGSETGGGGGAASDGDAMGVELHYGAEGRRLVDMAHAAVEDVFGMYVGDFPNYGDGGAYWSVNRNDNGSLPLTTFALDFALLEWGLVAAAARKLAFYMETWVTAKGFIDQGPGGENPGWVYGCPLGFPDGLADFGQLLDLWTATARAADAAAGAAAGASNWTAAQLPRAIALANYTLSMRRNATAHARPADRRGLIWGPGEHDTCHYPDYYFSTSMWAWRGMLEFGGWLRGAAGGAHAAFAAELLDECAAFRADIRAALNAAIVRGAGRNGTFNGTFVPPVAGAGQAPFGSMTQDRRASYSNFRYFAEMLSAGFLTDDEARALAAFREGHGGTLSGMTRYTDHLDDMPAIGYAQSDAALDRRGRFNLLLFGHMANYQSRGTFHSTEQLSLYGAAPANFRAYYTTSAEYDISFCVPSALLVAHMLKLALLWEPRDAPVPTVWLLRMAPRRWYRSSGDRAGDGAVAVTNAPTAVGRLSYTVFDAVEQPDSKGAGVRVELSLGRRSSGGLLKVRVRDAAAPGFVLRRLASAAADGASCFNATIAVDVEGEAVEVAWTGAPPQEGAAWSCALVATLV
jgi:hypothetical protein